MILISDVLSALYTWAPPQFAESYDNVGLLIGNPKTEVNKALITLDVTPEVIAEAIVNKANLIIAHHPIWFRSRKNLIGDDFTSKVVLQALQNNIAIIAIHTNLDNVSNGVNQKIAQKIGLQNIKILQAKKLLHPHDPTITVGAGMIGDLSEKMKPVDFLNHIKITFNAQGIRYTEFNSIPSISKVAICGGAGTFLIPEALNAGADAFVTADITYHYFFETLGTCLLMDIGHYESEQFTIELIFEWLSNYFSNFVNQKYFLMSSHNTNPVKYF